jgi:undecaprenyl pyrophosphate phosphatase UppP
MRPTLPQGLAAAFISALLAIKGLLRYISRHDFIIFAWYRIVFGLIRYRHSLQRSGAVDCYKDTGKY